MYGKSKVPIYDGMNMFVTKILYVFVFRFSTLMYKQEH